MKINRAFSFLADFSNQFAFDSSLPARFEENVMLEETIGNEAIVEKVIQPGKPGRVKYQGIWWSARCLQNVTLLPEQTVKVVGRMNLTLLVQPIPQHSYQQA